MTRYETVYVLDPSFDETMMSEMADKVSTWIKDLGGEIVEVQKWGKRRLAYEIMKKRDGVYTLFVWDGGGPMVKEVERRMGLEESLLRILTTIYVPPELSQGIVDGEGGSNSDDSDD